MKTRLLSFVVVSAVLAGGAATAGNAGGRTASAPLCAVTCFTAPAGSGALLLFTGHGFGHGVGMSQYGADGYALNGWTYQQILAHYFPGTTQATAPPATIRVLLADRKRKVTISSAVPWSFTDGAGTTHALAPGPITLDKSLQGLPAPLTFNPGAGGPLTLGRPYRGSILVDLVDGKLRAVNIVGLEDYLDGVVPAEMSPSWPAAALEAQAVAARSYALATRLVGAPYDEYADSRSQTYLGIAAETPATTAAVIATSNQVLMYAGKVATTFFFASSGGETASIAEAWGVTPLPYLISVPDPYDVLSPYHDWGPVPVTAQTIAKTLKVPRTIVSASTTADVSGRTGALELVTQPAASLAPVESTLTAGRVQAALGLRSSWFDVGLLSLAAPPASTPLPYGSSITLSGLVQGVDGVGLEQRPLLGSWQTVGPIVPGANGAVQLTEQPSITTDYRLATPTAAAAYVRVKVAPAVTLSTAPPAGTVAGTELPILNGAPVQVQLQGPDLTWTTAATGAVAADGTFSVPVQLPAGAVYRVVVTPGQGYAPAATAPLTASG